jgi:hypothetical protein
MRLEPIDDLLPGPALVRGLLPPDGLDLDLIVRDDEATVFQGRLETEGFAGSTRGLARFRGDDVEVVDLMPTSRLGLPDAEVVEMFEDAEPLEGFTNLRLPSPEHRLLLAARRFVITGEMDRSVAMRVGDVEDGSPDEWRRAASRAPLWGLESALRELERATAGEQPDAKARATMLAELASAAGTRPAKSSMLRTIVRRAVPPPPDVVAIEGADASTRSAVANGVADALAAAGVSVVVEQGERGAGAVDRDAGALWAGLLAAVDGLRHRWLVSRHAGRAEVVVFDRYVVGLVADFRRRYPKVSPTVGRTAIRALAPTPVASYLLDAEPSSSPGGETVDLLREEARHLRVTVVRGSATEHVDRLAADVWRVL